MTSFGKVAASSLLLLCMSISPVGTSFIPAVGDGNPCGGVAVVSSGVQGRNSSLKMNDELTRSYSDLLMF